MPIASHFGGSVSHSAVANGVIEQAPQTITRTNQSRQVTITGDSTAMTKAIDTILANYSLPEGYTAETAGASEDMMESFGNLGFALLVALLVYFVLAVQFKPFLMPAMVMILPAAFAGALFALPLTGRDLSIMALGIGGTNGIMGGMGVVMTSGMVISTVVTLVFTPAIIPF